MTTGHHVRIPLRPIDTSARDGSYHFLAGREGLAMARWNGEAFVYPGGALVEFAPRYSYPAGQVIRPADEVAS